MTKLVDAFTFYNEIEILKFRLKYLNEIVDNFVISEATKTHSGIDRELIFPSLRNQIPEDILNKIVYVVVDDMNSEQGHSGNWGREKHQRICLERGFNQLNLSDDDYIMISDIDEIPRKLPLKEAKESSLNAFYMELFFFYFSIDYQIFWTQDTPGLWGSPKALKYGYYKQLSINCDIVRNTGQYGMDIPMTPIPNGGWHFSYFGGVDRIKNKLESYAHQEFNNDIVKQNIHTNIVSNSNILNPGDNTIFKPADRSIFDDEVLNDPEFFPYISLNF